MEDSEYLSLTGWVTNVNNIPLYKSWLVVTVPIDAVHKVTVTAVHLAELRAVTIH